MSPEEMEAARASMALEGWLPMEGMLLVRGSQRYRLLARISIDGGWGAYAPEPAEEPFAFLGPSYLRTCTMDLTDPATAGCLSKLLGSEAWRVSLGGWQTGYLVNVSLPDQPAFSPRPFLGVACCDVALALGRWPGGAR